jgi:hypothetical protein
MDTDQRTGVEPATAHAGAHRAGARRAGAHHEGARLTGAPHRGGNKANRPRLRTHPSSYGTDERKTTGSVIKNI